MDFSLLIEVYGREKVVDAVKKMIEDLTIAEVKDGQTLTTAGGYINCDCISVDLKDTPAPPVPEPPAPPVPEPPAPPAPPKRTRAKKTAPVAETSFTTLVMFINQNKIPMERVEQACESFNTRFQYLVKPENQNLIEGIINELTVS